MESGKEEVGQRKEEAGGGESRGRMKRKREGQRKEEVKRWKGQKKKWVGDEQTEIVVKKGRSSQSKQREERATEVFHLEFCKYLLQVHRSTSNSACRAELGRFPLWLTIQQRVLSYWMHIQNSSPSTYHHKASLSHGAQATPGVLKQNVSSQPSQDPQYSLTKGQIKGTIESCKVQYLDKWRSDIKNSQKLTIYQTLQREYTMAPYLERLHHPKDRKTLSLYRLSAHSLEIETGRHRQTWKPREERLCRQCDLGVLEDEAHFLLHCSKYAPLRTAHFQRLSTHIPDFNSTDEERKLCILLGEEETTVQIAAQYVIACHQLRGT